MPIASPRAAGGGPGRSPDGGRSGVDLVLIMSVNPGYSGQAFIPEVLDKARTVSAALEPEQRLAIDGGVNVETATACLAAGCDVLMAASAIYGSDDYAGSIAALRGGAGIVAGSS